jgi:small subunit ribosomal protein S17
MVRNIGIQAKAPEKECNDIKCPWHGELPVRGRVFQGEVVSDKAPKTVVVKWGYTHYITKYERYERRHSDVVAYNPSCIAAKVGDIVRIAECRPLSKTKTFIVIEKVK